MANEQCEFYGHYWGRGPVSGMLVCCRKRCTTQAVCSVCVSGFVPGGFFVALCTAHQPEPTVREPERTRRQRERSSAQLSFW